MLFKIGDEVITVFCSTNLSAFSIGLTGKIVESTGKVPTNTFIISGYPNYEFYPHEIRLLTKLEKVL